jgi:hypothetical protein
MSHENSPGGAPTVVYIAGSGRSGSTLLERALGEMPGHVNVGELIDLFRRDAPRSERCGCGLPLGDCPFWSNVGKRAFGDWDSGQLGAVERMKRRVGRQRHIPRMLALPLAGRDFRTTVASYGTSYANLYRAIAAEAGAKCVVDASKWPAQALALSRAGLDIRVIHLIRDVRGVAYSLSKQGVHRPQALDESDVMWNKKPTSAAAHWAARQTELEFMHRLGVPVTRMRYEEFVSHPRRAVEKALTELGLGYEPQDLRHIGDGRLTLSASHGIAGNPSRFNEGEITLRADEAWREKMSPRDRRLVTAMMLPLIVGYGWLPRRRPKP